MRELGPDETNSAILSEDVKHSFPAINPHATGIYTDDECPNMKGAGFCWYCCPDCNLELHKCTDCGEILNHYYRNVDDTPHDC